MRQIISVAGILLLMVLAVACNGAPSAVAPTVAAPPAPASTVAAPTPTAAAVIESGVKEYEDFDPRNFARSTIINNEWFPLKPGMQFVYYGHTDHDGQIVPRRLVITVTDLIKVIDGVPSVVTWDLDYAAEELVEAELAFFAQDNDGNVWRMGEYPEEYEDGKFVLAPTWLHGIEDAKAGIIMQAESRVGTRSYSQGWGPAVGFTDRGRVRQVGQKTNVPFGNYSNVLVIEEFSQKEPDGFQLKYYARGVGNIQVGWTGADKTRESLELIDYFQLSPEALSKIRADALKLENHAYEVSPNVYGRTLPAERSSGMSKSP